MTQWLSIKKGMKLRVPCQESWVYCTICSGPCSWPRHLQVSLSIFWYNPIKKGQHASYLFLARLVTMQEQLLVNTSTPVSDQDTIFLYNINTVASRQVRRIKKKTQLHVGDYKLIQYQILQLFYSRQEGELLMRSWE